MKKTIYSENYAVFLSCLRRARKRAGLTQEQLAERIHQTQSFVSKCERGERRVDIIELRSFCQAMDIPLMEFIQQLETTLKANDRS